MFDSFEIPGQPEDEVMPIIQLARHIFSICANSVSCERLFSTFGNILTKVRNRMGKETLQTLTEIKMHVRDEHIMHGGMKSRLKRCFGTVNVSASQDPAGPPPSLPSLVQVGGIAPVNHIPPTSPTGQNSQDESSDQAAGTEDSLPDGTSIRTLGEIVGWFLQQGELDGGEPETDTSAVPLPQETVNAPVSLEIDILAAPPPQETVNTPVSLEDLSDFTRDNWVAYHQRTSRRSLGEEMEVYSLLNTDLPGEEGNKVEIDDTAGEVLTLNFEGSLQ